MTKSQTSRDEDHRSHRSNDHTTHEHRPGYSPLQFHSSQNKKHQSAQATTKPRAPSEAMITQLTNTVGNGNRRQNAVARKTSLIITRKNQTIKHTKTAAIAEDKPSWQSTFTKRSTPNGLNSPGYYEFDKSTVSKALRSNPLKRRRRAKRHTTKTPAPSKAMITQLTNTVRDAHMFNATLPKTRNTNPLERRTRTKIHATKTLALVEAMITQLTNTVGDAHLFNSTPFKTGNTNPLKRQSKLTVYRLLKASKCRHNVTRCICHISR